VLNHSEGDYDDGPDPYPDDIRAFDSRVYGDSGARDLPAYLRFDCTASSKPYIALRGRRPLRRDVLFSIGYACVISLVIWAVFAVTKNPPPRKSREQFRREWQNKVPSIDEDAIKKKWDHALQRLGL
jgi:hypothetical protein